MRLRLLELGSTTLRSGDDPRLPCVRRDPGKFFPSRTLSSLMRNVHGAPLMHRSWAAVSLVAWIVACGSASHSGPSKNGDGDEGQAGTGAVNRAGGTGAPMAGAPGNAGTSNVG